MRRAARIRARLPSQTAPRWPRRLARRCRTRALRDRGRGGRRLRADHTRERHRYRQPTQDHYAGTLEQEPRRRARAGSLARARAGRGAPATIATRLSRSAEGTEDGTDRRGRAASEAPHRAAQPSASSPVVRPNDRRGGFLPALEKERPLADRQRRGGGVVNPRPGRDDDRGGARGRELIRGHLDVEMAGGRGDAVERDPIVDGHDRR